MKNKYTVIYNKRWMSGSHWQCLTRMKRVELECDSNNLINKIADLVNSDDIVYIFEGWPKMQGETDEDVVAN